MVVLAAPFLASAALLGAAGAAKVRRPDSTARALSEMGFAVRPALVRIAAAVEVAVAAGALAWASPPFAAAVALSYLGFAAFVLVALRRDVPLSSCGCFGVLDTPPTYRHLALNLAAGVVALGVVLSPGGSAVGDIARVEGSPLLRLVFVVGTATCGWFAYVLLRSSHA